MRSDLSPTVSKMSPSEDSIFTAGLDDVTTMSSILHELYPTDEQSILVITADGIRLITAGEKSFQVSAFFVSSIFQQYEFNGRDRVHFRLYLKDFIECLNLLRDDPIVEGDRVQPIEENQVSDMMTTSLCLQYRKQGEPLLLRLENKSNYVINCGLSGFTKSHDSRFCPLAFQEDEDTAVIVLNSKKFYDYVSGLDLISSDFVQLVMSRQDEIPIKLSTKSTQLGEVELHIHEDEKEIIKRDLIVSDNLVFAHWYKTAFMKPALEGLKTSVLVQIKCGSSGLLCIEHFHGTCDKSTRDGPFKKPAANNHVRDQEVGDMLNNYNLGQNKRSSVEYFILSEVKPLDEACPGYDY